MTRARRVVAYRARCSCGAESEPLAHRDDAVHAFAMHVAAQAELERERGELEADELE